MSARDREDMRTLHVITPGDHYSPLTGSAIPTVVHGLCAHGPAGAATPTVAVARGTNPVRYTSADIVEYEAAAPIHYPRGLSATRADAVTAWMGLPRFSARRSYRAALRAQQDWPSSLVFGHNAPQLIQLVDTTRHIPFLYAHNALLRTYRRPEADRALGPVAGIICVSEYLAAETRSHLSPRLHDRVRVVRNGVDTEVFHRRRPLRGSDALEVVFVGRMIPEKGADVLVEAVSLLDRSDIHLTLVGSRGFSATDPATPYERSVRTRTTALGGRVNLKPFLPREQIAQVLGSADVVVVPSRWPEPFALTVLEGMASGAAVIGSEIGGIPESLRGHGLLVRPDDASELASALESLADDVELLRRTADVGLAYAGDHDWRHSAETLNDVVKDLT